MQPPAHKEVVEANEPLLPLPFNEEEDLYLSDNSLIPTNMEEAYALVKSSHKELREALSRLEALKGDEPIDGEKLVRAFISVIYIPRVHSRPSSSPRVKPMCAACKQ